MKYEKKFVTVEHVLPSTSVLFFSSQFSSAFLNNAENHKDLYLYIIQIVSHNFYIIKLIIIKDRYFSTAYIRLDNSFYRKHKNNISLTKGTEHFHNTKSMHIVKDHYPKFNTKNFSSSLIKDKHFTLREEINSISRIENLVFSILNNRVTPFNIYNVIIIQSLFLFFSILYTKFIHQSNTSVKNSLPFKISLFTANYITKYCQYESLKVYYNRVSNRKYLKNHLVGVQINLDRVKNTFNNTQGNFYE